MFKMQLVYIVLLTLDIAATSSTLHDDLESVKSPQRERVKGGVLALVCVGNDIQGIKNLETRTKLTQLGSRSVASSGAAILIMLNVRLSCATPNVL